MPSKEDADRILEARRKRKACYPCASRKVKCNGVLPCSNCVKRRHPEICMVDDTSERLTTRRRTADRHSASGVGGTSAGRNGDRQSLSLDGSHVEKSDTIASNTGGFVQSDNQDVNAGRNATTSPLVNAASPDQDAEALEPQDPSFVGVNATPSFVSGSPFANMSALERDVRPALGLQNTLKSYPFMKDGTAKSAIEQVNRLIPTHADVLRYAQYYQTVVYPIHHLISDQNDLEALIDTYLELTASRESSAAPATGEEERPDVARTCLLLAVLASGAQFSDLSNSDRMRVSRDFARRSFHCARLANFLLRPNFNTIQALLILGHVLQNDGQADAAWALLGTNIRLAQSIGLHSHSPEMEPSRLSEHKRALWSAILSQDCVLSMSFDRSPFGTSTSGLSTPAVSGNHDFVSCMSELTEICRAYLALPHAVRATVETASHYLGLLDGLRARRDTYVGIPVARASRRVRVEQYALYLHFAYSEQVICRIFLQREISAANINHPDQMSLAIRAKVSFVRTMQAFLDLQALSTVPLRSWSMIHAGISSALLLELFGHQDLPQAESAHEIQSRFIKVLTSERPGSDSTNDADHQPWLSTLHSKASNALQNSIARRREAMAEQSNAGAQLVTAVPQGDGPILPLQADLGVGQPEMYDNLFDDFGNIDWGNDFFDNSMAFEPTFDQLEWGL